MSPWTRFKYYKISSKCLLWNRKGWVWVTTVWKVTGTVVDVRDFDLSWWPVLMYHYFDVSWLVLTNLVECVWLVCWLPPVSCYFADHPQLSQALLFHKVRFIASVLYAVTLSCYHVTYWSVYSVKDKVSRSLCPGSCFKFLLLVFPELLEFSRCHWKCVAMFVISVFVTVL